MLDSTVCNLEVGLAIPIPSLEFVLSQTRLALELRTLVLLQKVILPAAPEPLFGVAQVGATPEPALVKTWPLVPGKLLGVNRQKTEHCQLHPKQTRA